MADHKLGYYMKELRQLRSDSDLYVFSPPLPPWYKMVGTVGV
jgi:hypothetical protein